jgi:hypothetical protein
VQILVNYWLCGILISNVAATVIVIVTKHKGGEDGGCFEEVGYRLSWGMPPNINQLII